MNKIETKQELLVHIENRRAEQYRIATKFFDDYIGADEMCRDVKNVVKMIEQGKATNVAFETLNRYNLIPQMTYNRFSEIVKGL